VSLAWTPSIWEGSHAFQRSGSAGQSPATPTRSRALAAHLIPARQLERQEQQPRLTTGITALDELLGGGWRRGALCEIAGARGSGRTSVLLAALATALRQGHCAALVDSDGALDARAAGRSGVPLPRLLWVRCAQRDPAQALAAAKIVLGAGGFTLVAVDLGDRMPRVPTASWIKLKRAAAEQHAILLVAAAQRIPGALGTAALALRSVRPQVAQTKDGMPPARLCGLEILAQVERGVHGPASSVFVLSHVLSR
jgi:protein ImuA